MNLTIQEMLKATKGTLIQGDQNTLIHNLSIDSRTIHSEDFYLPLRGENFDGHDFIAQAIERKASGIFKEQSWSLSNIEEVLSKHPDINIIEVEDTLQALQNLSGYKKEQVSPNIIGITGSVGKTTTKDMISQVLGEGFSILKTKGNFNNEVGLPLTLLNLQIDHEMAVLEMGMSNFGEIQRLVEIAPPNIAVITNIGSAHIQYLKSKENILKAKMEIASNLKKEDILLLNGDDPLLWNIRNMKTDYKKVFYGICDRNDIHPTRIIEGEDGCTFYVDIAGENRKFHLNIPGKHQINNALAAIWIGHYYHMGWDAIDKGLEKVIISDMRFETHRVFGAKIINDAYNASPESMEASIEVVNNMKDYRRTLVLGDILELGDYSEIGHRKVGEYLSKGDFYRLITKGQDSKWIGMEAIRQGFPAENVYHVESNEKAAKLLENWLSPQDLVLIKGSRGMKMEEIIDYLKKGRQMDV